MFVLAVLGDYVNPDCSGATEFMGEKLPYSSHDLPKFIQTVLTELWPKRFSKRQRVFGIFPATGGGEFASLLVPCHDYGDGLLRVLVIEPHCKFTVWALQEDNAWKDEGPPIGLRVMNLSMRDESSNRGPYTANRRLVMESRVSRDDLVEEQRLLEPGYDPLVMPESAGTVLGVFGNGPSELPNGLKELDTLKADEISELDDVLGYPKNPSSSPSQVATLMSENVSSAVVETVRTPDPEPVESSVSSGSDTGSDSGSNDSGSSGDSGGGASD